MPKYRFGWDAFDDATVEAVARDCGLQGGDPRGLLKRRWARPDEELVRLSKKALERTWLLDYPMTQMLVSKLRDLFLGPMNQPLSREEYIDYIVNCRNTSRFRRILLEHLLKFGEGRPFAEIADGSILGYAAMKVVEQPVDPRKPFPYQQEAWNALSACLARIGSKGGFPGLLVMPTGSGKTFTAVHWLMENIIARGMRVMWVAHRDVLLEQAWHEFKRLAHLAASGRSERMTVRIVSGKYDSASMLTPDDHVMLCSVASLARHRAVVQNILRDPNVFLVIDEAHHAPAKSYLDIIRYMKSLKNNQLLGLTATPTRMSDSEATVLSSVFNNNIVYQAALGDLIERGYLARPKKIRVFTDVDVEAGMTADERQHLARFDELSEETLDRIGRLDERNNLIVGHYIENKAKYGKTLVFATRVDHAALLREKFRAQGIEAEYIASHSPDGEATNIDAVRERFSKPGSGLDVLINVQMLTEGVDIPAVQTVLLGWPTNSAVLMQQMIGRALRGTKAGGTDIAYLVLFEDHWERFTQFERPFTLVPSLASFEEETAGAAGETEDVHADAELQDGVAGALPLEVFREVPAALSRLRDSKAQVFEAIRRDTCLAAQWHQGLKNRHMAVSVSTFRRSCPIDASLVSVWMASETNICRKAEPL